MIAHNETLNSRLLLLLTLAATLFGSSICCFVSSFQPKCDHDVRRQLRLDHHPRRIHTNPLLMMYARSLNSPRKSLGLIFSSLSSSSESSSQSSSSSPSNSSFSAAPERPTPAMPSSLFRDLAESQLELLAGALKATTTTSGSSSALSASSKVKSMALYLPQENSLSGQLEFIPAVLYPPPSRDRVFIASGAESGVAPTIPRTLTTLPGFSQARSLLPGYPMVQSGDEPGVGAVEEAWCAVGDGTTSTGAALSVPLLAGSQTTGVLLVHPSSVDDNSKSVWTAADRDQVARAAKTLSLALSMDAARTASEQRQQVFAQALSDNLHQVKNPLQALRTYGKLLQQRIADIDGDGGNSSVGGTRQLLELADHLMIQGDRLTARLQPVDAIIDQYNIESSSRQPPLALLPAHEKATTRWTTPLLPFQEDETSSSGSSTSGILAQYNSKRTPTESPTVDMSSLGGEFECEMTFVADVLAPTLSSFRTIALDQEIAFEVTEEVDLPGVVANADALQEAVSNVIDNAIKYVKLPKSSASDEDVNPSPKVRVQIFPNQDSNSSGVTILVEDNGPGISHGAEEEIFERGFRDESTQGVSGSGIGLHIARELVRKMGGTLKVTKHREKRKGALNGARFEFRLYRRPKQ